MQSTTPTITAVRAHPPTVAQALPGAAAEDSAAAQEAVAVHAAAVAADEADAGNIAGMMPAGSQHSVTEFRCHKEYA